MNERPSEAIKYFQALLERNFSTAETILSNFREKLNGDEWGMGYACAMEGLLLSTRSNDDRYLYYKRLPSSQELLRESRRKCRRHLAEIDVLDPKFDKGFFACWLDFLRSVEGALSDAAAHPPSKSAPRVTAPRVTAPYPHKRV